MFGADKIADFPHVITSSGERNLITIFPRSPEFSEYDSNDYWQFRQGGGINFRYYYLTVRCTLLRATICNTHANLWLWVYVCDCQQFRLTAVDNLNLIFTKRLLWHDSASDSSEFGRYLYSHWHFIKSIASLCQITSHEIGQLKKKISRASGPLHSRNKNPSSDHLINRMFINFSLFFVGKS